MEHYWDRECECDWCQWQCELYYGTDGGLIGALVLRMMLHDQTS